jgi:hypothetical protein
MIDDATGTGSASAQQAVRDIEKRRRREHEEDLHSLMSHDWGRRLCYWLIYELGGLHAPSFAGGIKDGVCAALHSAKTEGFREMAGAVMQQVQSLALNDYLIMMSEQIQNRQAEMQHIHTHTHTQGEA